MINRNELVNYLNNFLAIHNFKDYCPNGLQVTGRNEIKKIICAVTANLKIVEIAAEKNADAILVHHGYFWQGESPVITGIQNARLKTLLTHDINLLAYHLPLDAHATLGNNAKLGEQLNFTLDYTHDLPGQPGLIAVGHLPTAMTPDQLNQHINLRLAREPLHVAARKNSIQRIAWCTGAAEDFIQIAAEAGCDAYISGEVKERTYYQAQELDIHFYAAGHHATERYGIKALGEHLQQQFAVEVEFVDSANPV